MKSVLSLLASILLGIGSLHSADNPAIPTDNLQQKIIEVSQNNFDDLMHFSKPVIIDVYANRCVYCKRLDPILKELSQEMGADYRFAQLSLDREPQLVDSFNVRGFPTILFIKKGKEIGRHVGFMTKETFKSEIEKQFGVK